MLKMVTAIYARLLEQFQHMTQPHPASQSDAVRTGCENLYCVCL